MTGVQTCALPISTLQEAADADLLLHVIDASSPVLEDQMAEVQRVLGDIGAGEIPQVLVYNKLDNLDGSRRPHELVDVLELDAGVRVPRVFVSAIDGTGLPELRRLLASAAAGTLSADLNSMHSSSNWDPASQTDPEEDRTGAPQEHHHQQPQ